jgi:hypothetical protein
LKLSWNLSLKEEEFKGRRSSKEEGVVVKGGRGRRGGEVKGQLNASF